MNFWYSVQFVFAEVTSTTVRLFFFFRTQPHSQMVTSNGNYMWNKRHFLFTVNSLEFDSHAILKKKVRRFYSENRSDVRYILIWECVKKKNVFVDWHSYTFCFLELNGNLPFNNHKMYFYRTLGSLKSSVCEESNKMCRFQLCQQLFQQFCEKIKQIQT